MLQRIATDVVSAYSAGGDPSSIASAAHRAFQELYDVVALLIGQAGVNALTERALHLARREYVWLVPKRTAEHRDDLFASVAVVIALQEPEAARAAAAAVLAEFCGLLVAFLGEGLTMRLLRKAWPEAALGPESNKGAGA